MQIARVIAPVYSLGPKGRVVVWTRGCHRHCRGCASPELWNANPDTDFPVEAVKEYILSAAATSHSTELTISGGEPLEQALELSELLRQIRPHFTDILLFTGYNLHEIEAGIAGPAATQALSYTDVLVDGPYMEELNTTECVLRGSNNQGIHFLRKEHFDRYADYIRQGRKQETHVLDGEILTVGIADREEKL